MVVAQRGLEEIGAGSVEFGAIERRQHVVHVFIQRDVGEHPAALLFADLGGIAKGLGGMDLLRQSGAVYRVAGHEQGGVEGLQRGHGIAWRLGWP